MPSFRITIDASKRASGRFVYRVRRALQKAYAEEQAKRSLTQTAIARAIGVHRSVINRELRGKKDMTLGRVGELAWAMGRKISFELPEVIARDGANIQASGEPEWLEPSKPALDSGTENVAELEREAA